MGRDLMNVAIGIVWQVSLTALPIYIVLRSWNAVWALLALGHRHVNHSQSQLV